jgi:hypothetical protein
MRRVDMLARRVGLISRLGDMLLRRGGKRKKVTGTFGPLLPPFFDFFDFAVIKIIPPRSIKSTRTVESADILH